MNPRRSPAIAPIAGGWWKPTGCFAPAAVICCGRAAPIAAGRPPAGIASARGAGTGGEGRHEASTLARGRNAVDFRGRIGGVRLQRLGLQLWSLHPADPLLLRPLRLSAARFDRHRRPESALAASAAAAEGGRPLLPLWGAATWRLGFLPPLRKSCQRRRQGALTVRDQWNGEGRAGNNSRPGLVLFCSLSRNVSPVVGSDNCRSLRRPGGLRAWPGSPSAVREPRHRQQRLRPGWSCRSEAAG